jgi:hypothetical protein
MMGEVGFHSAASRNRIWNCPQMTEILADGEEGESQVKWHGHGVME